MLYASRNCVKKKEIDTALNSREFLLFPVLSIQNTLLEIKSILLSLFIKKQSFLGKVGVIHLNQLLFLLMALFLNNDNQTEAALLRSFEYIISHCLFFTKYWLKKLFPALYQRYNRRF